MPLALFAISDIAHTIQSSLAPVFLLAAIAGFLNVLTGRLGRIVDRARQIEREFTAADHPEHARQVWELRLLDTRIRIVNAAIFLCTASAVAICFVVAGLFVAVLAQLGFARTMAFAFILAMALLVAGLVAFLVEVRIAGRSIMVRDELLERQRK
jgi:hypothetical protein